ncbi:unnamed protein product [Adineta ricciae]|uniref:EGF-like domain-containing protein n=1 Tax=Adineta ricciae TaxID=249248 RepID=A0A815BY80_ADIRI|nr:unnamed protein product [Adineta ricciae]CAF1635451.1 unnamed protein product [Adineta ricciae]
MANLFQYTNLFVTLNGDIYFENGGENGRIEKFTSNSTNSSFVAQFSGNCFGLFIDIRNNLYCSLRHEHRVVKIMLDDDIRIVITIAGTVNKTGSRPYELNQPWGIFVDANFNLYVADHQNNRIQVFPHGKMNGTTATGKNSLTNLTLYHPTDVILDGERDLYIADNRNHRIVRLRNGWYECIVGCSGQSGSASDRLNISYSVRFDSVGNLYVADERNRRIQKFGISGNSCGKLSFYSQKVDSNPFRYAAISSIPEYTTSSRQTSTNELTTINTKPTTTSNYFLAPLCKISTNIGWNCNISGTICDIRQPCLNNGTCDSINQNQDYKCSCLSHFSGKHCEVDERICKENTCLNHGNCSVASNSTYRCICSPGYEGMRCEKRINYCLNVTCYNKGVCRPLLLDYKCECLRGTWGKQCENIETKITIIKIVAKSFAYIAILAMITVALFIIIMDVLKYFFGIDLTKKEVERIRRAKKRRRPVIQRFVYVNALPSSEKRSLSLIVEEVTDASQDNRISLQ